MATMLAQFKIKAGSEAAYERIQSWLYEQTHTQEPNIRRYEFYRGREPGQYYGLLSFDDFHEFLTHQTSDYHEAFSKEFRDYVEDSSFDWVDPLPGACDAGPTKAQPLPENASPLAQSYASMMGIEEPAWWLALRQNTP